MSQASEYAANVSRILQQKGDAIAEGKRRSGAIIGNTVATLGQVIPQQVQEAMKASAMKNLAKQHVGDLDGYITALEGIDPATALDLRKKKADADKVVDERTKVERENKLKALTQFRDDLNTVKSPEDYTRLHYIYSQTYGPESLKGVPTEYDPQFVEQMKQRIEKEIGPLVPVPGPGGSTVYATREQAVGKAVPPDPATTGPLVPIPGPDGTSVYGTREQAVGKPIPQTAAKAGDVNAGSFEDYVIRYAADKGTTVDKLTSKDIEAARKRYQQANDRPININTGGGGGLSPTQESNVLNRISQQWKSASAPAADLSRQSNLMEVGMQAARRGDLAQGSQVVLVTFQKILDPPSVVRESEYMRSAAGQSLINRVKGYAERLAKGGAGITLPELEKFAAVARDAVKAQTTGYMEATKERIGKTADRYKIPRELVFEDFDFTAPFAPIQTGGPKPKPRVDPFAPKK